MSKIFNPFVVDLAKRSRDESLSTAERLHALYMVGKFAETFGITCDAPKADKPQYVWRNGARVKVK